MANYFDLDDILSEEEPVFVGFRTEAAGVGILDPSSEENRVEQGSKVEVPFWLAQELYNAEAAIVHLPHFYNERTRKEMKADPACFDLRSRCPYFYELGSKLVPLVSDPSLGPFLLYTLKTRFKEMLSKSHSAAVSLVPRFLARLTREEMHIFEAGSESMKAFRKWRIEGTRLEKAAVLGKKKRPAGED